jgi:hypothetical protein
LTRTHINGQHFTGWTNLFGKKKGGNAMAGSDIEDSQAWAKV